jgi:sialate O-acetylesterase
VKSFSAVGYFFGRQLHQTLDVPIGLIDDAWGGSSAEAWIRRDVLQADPKYADLLARWKETEATFDWDTVQATFKKRLAKWQEARKNAIAAGKQPPARPRAPRNVLEGQHRPANIYNGVLLPTIGYGIRGAIWYQGESNAGRAYQYRDLFPLMISFWRKEWGIGDFPFYWVQLADFQDESPEPQDSAWAELREAQTMTMDKLPNTGQAVIYDLGEAHDIHPRDKQNVAKRLARWALANEYGYDIPYRSPQYKSMEKKGSRIVLTFDHVGGGLDTHDVRQPIGFAVAGEDQQFHWAQARILGKDQIEVWSDEVSDPVAVRYAWANNPVANVQSKEGLKLTPFRTDDWKGVTEGVTK